MNYDFDKITQRRGTDCVKWDETTDPDMLPMWVADMDFETAPCVAEAIQRRAAHPIYGYGHVPDGFYEAISWWNTSRHGWTPQRQWVLYTSGVVAAFSAIIQGLCRKGEPVLTLTPAYNCFFSSIRNAHCPLVDLPLSWDPSTALHTIDFQAFEQAISSRGVHVFLLCNPHNPSGRVWTEDELRKMAQICKSHDVIVVADEIHCEFVDPQLGRPYVPFARIAQEVGCSWVVANAPNKAFNIAGLQTAYIVAPDAAMRQQIDRALNDNETCDINIFSYVALQAAYTPEGAEWLDQLVAYIYENYRIFLQMMQSALPSLPIARLEGTYLAWVDVRSLEESSEDIAERLQRENHVWINGGAMYGRSGFLRVNLATQRSRMIEATRRIITGLQKQ